jgi:hypothetical protein
MAQHCRELLLLSRGESPLAGAPNHFLAHFVRGHIEELDRLLKSSREAIEAAGGAVARARAAAGHVPLYSVGAVSGQSAHGVAVSVAWLFWSQAWGEANRQEAAAEFRAAKRGQSYATLFGNPQLLERHGEAIGTALASTPFRSEDMNTLAAAVTGEKLLLEKAGRSDDPACPRWDAERGELWYGDKLCKRINRRAKYQRQILDEFESLGWPSRLDDPLEGAGPDEDPVKRLRNVVQKLNACQHIKFELDGTGEGIIWRPVIGW